MSNIRILIIEDEAIIAQDIESQIEELGYDSAGIIHNGDKAVDYLSFHTPDLVLCDINIKGTLDGIDVANAVRAKKKIPFVFLTSMTDRGTIEKAKSALPYGYIVKPFDKRDLLTNIEMALFKFSQEIDALKLTREKVNALATTPLTDQEFKILNEIINGLSNQQIIEKLHISINTLKYHMKNLLTKMDVKNRAEVLQKLLESIIN